MAVTLNGKNPIDDNKQWVFCTLTVDGDICKHITVQPYNNDTTAIITVDEDLTTYLNNKEDVIKLTVLKRMYPGANYSESNGDTKLEKFTQWIADGQINPIVYEYDEPTETDDEPTADYDSLPSTELNLKPKKIKTKKLIREASFIEKVSCPTEFDMPHPDKAETIDRGQMSDKTRALLNDASSWEDIKSFLQSVFKTV